MSPGPKVLWFPYSQRGALYPVMPMIQELRKRADLIAVGPPSFAAFARQHGIAFTAYRSGLDYDWSRPETVDPRSRGPVDGRERFLERVAVEAADATAAIDAVAPAVVLTDSFHPGSGLAAERSGIPWASYVHYLFDERAETDDLFRGWWDRAGADPGHAFADWWTAVRRAAGCGPDPRPLSDALWYRMSPHLTLMVTHPELRRRGRPLPAYVRRAHLPPWDASPGSARPPLPPRRPGRRRLLVANSSAWQADVDLIQNAVTGLKGTDIDVIATVAAEHRLVLPSSEDAIVLSYHAHTELLPHVDAVLTTAGAGIAGKALWFGKPVVAAPFARDQHYVAEAIVENGLGNLVVAPVTPESVAEAVAGVLHRGPAVRAAQVAGPRPDLPGAAEASDMVLRLCEAPR